MKVFWKEYQRVMYRLNLYISSMMTKEGWNREISITKKDYEFLVKSGNAKEISPGRAKYRQEYTLIVG